MYLGSIKNLFDAKIEKLIIGYGQQSGNILYYSDNIPSALKFTNDEFQFIKNIHDLMPPPIDQYHDDLVMNFYTTGKNRFFRNYSTLLAQCKDNDLKQFELVCDLNPLISTDLVYTCLIKEQPSASVIMLIDDQKRIRSYSKNIMQYTGAWSGAGAQSTDKTPAVLSNMNIAELIPSFDQYTESASQTAKMTASANKVLMLMPRAAATTSTQQQLSHDTNTQVPNMSHKSMSQAPNASARTSVTDKFYTSIKITIRSYSVNARHIKYYILEAYNIVSESHMNDESNECYNLINEFNAQQLNYENMNVNNQQTVVAQSNIFIDAIEQFNENLFKNSGRSAAANNSNNNIIMSGIESSSRMHGTGN